MKRWGLFGRVLHRSARQCLGDHPAAFGAGPLAACIGGFAVILLAPQSARADSPLPPCSSSASQAYTTNSAGQLVACPGHNVPAVATPYSRAPAPTYRSSPGQVLSNNIDALSTGLGYFAQQQAEQQQAQQQAQDQANAIAAQRQAEENARRQQEAARQAEVNRHLPNPFAAGEAPPGPTVRNPFAPQDGGAGGAGKPAQTASAGPNPFAAGGADAASHDPKEPPTRKLGDPQAAANLAPITRSACVAMKPRADVIRLPEGSGYCVVEVDTPELTNEWHRLVDDSKPEPAPRAKPVVATMGVRD